MIPIYQIRKCIYHVINSIQINTYLLGEMRGIVGRAWCFDIDGTYVYTDDLHMQ